MKCLLSNVLCGAVVCALCRVAAANEPASDAPKPVPRTRPEVKRALEALKQRQPRLPLPQPTAEELATRGDRSLVNNGRMRALYLPKSWSTSRGGSGNSDPAMTLDYALKTECFWIVSRANNCYY